MILSFIFSEKRHESALFKRTAMGRIIEELRSMYIYAFLLEHPIVNIATKTRVIIFKREGFICVIFI